MSKQKFQIGNSVVSVAGDYDAIGTIINTTHYNDRLLYTVKFTLQNGARAYKNYYSYELKFPDINFSEEEFRGPYGYVPNFNKEEEKLNTTKSFLIGDIVRVTAPCGYVPSIGKIINTKEEDNKCFYEVEFIGGKEKYLDYQLVKPSINELTFYKECCDLMNTPKEDNSKNNCKYCGVPFDEIEESDIEPGACEYCIELRDLISDVNLRKSGHVDLEHFSSFGHKGDWLEVTEWANTEGIDICIHYANDHDETNHNFMLSYDELSAVMNIVNKFGKLPPIFTKPENK